MPSSPQSVPLVRVYDYLITPTGAAAGNAASRPGRTVTATLVGPSPTFIGDATTIAPTTQVPRQQPIQSSVTDGNGYWELWLIPTDNMTPAGLRYLIDDGYRVYKVNPVLAGIPGPGWQSSAIPG